MYINHLECFKFLTIDLILETVGSLDLPEAPELEVTLIDNLLELREVASRGAALSNNWGMPAAPTFCKTACGMWIVPV